MTMCRRILIVAILWCLGYPTWAHAQFNRCQDELDHLDRAHRAELATVTGLLSQCAKTNKDLKEEIGRHISRLNGIDSLKISVDVRHDHERFVFGADYDIRITIDNNSSIDAFLVPSEVSVQPPPELTLPHHEGLEQILGQNGECIVGHNNLPTMSFNAPKPMQGLQISAGSRYTLTWKCPKRTSDKYSEIESSIILFMRKIAFRPDMYTFTVNVPIRYNPLGKADGDKSAITTKSADKSIKTDLDRLFIFISSALGAIGAVIVNACFSIVAIYGERKRHDAPGYGYFIEKVRFDHLWMIPVALILSPLLVTATDFTHKFDRGVSIQIFDFFGAILAGFLIQMMVMRLGTPTTDQLLKKIMARDVRDDLP